MSDVIQLVAFFSLRFLDSLRNEKNPLRGVICLLKMYSFGARLGLITVPRIRVFGYSLLY